MQLNPIYYCAIIGSIFVTATGIELVEVSTEIFRCDTWLTGRNPKLAKIPCSF